MNPNNSYSPWLDTSTRIWYAGSAVRNVTFANATYLAGDNADTGSLETDNFDGTRGAQRTFASPGLTGEVWVSMLVRVRSGALLSQGLVFSVHDAAYDSGGVAAKSHIGLGDPTGTSTNLAPMFLPTRDGTPEYGSDGSFVESTSESATYLFVAKLDITVGTDSVSFWVLKASDTYGWSEVSLGSPDLTKTADFGSSAMNVWVGQKSAISYFDAIRVSNATGDAGLREVLTGLPAPAGGTVILLR